MKIRSSLHTPTAGLMMKALWRWASSSILCTTLRKVNVQPSMGSSLRGLDLMFKISFLWIQKENKSKALFEDTWPDVQDWSQPVQVWTLQGAAGRSPADQPQKEPVCSEMIHLISWKKRTWPEQRDLLRVRRRHRWRQLASFPHRPGHKYDHWSNAFIFP